MSKYDVQKAKAPIFNGWQLHMIMYACVYIYIYPMNKNLPVQGQKVAGDGCIGLLRALYACACLLVIYYNIYDV